MHASTLQSAQGAGGPDTVGIARRAAGPQPAMLPGAAPTPSHEFSSIARTTLDILLGYTGLRIITRKASPQRAFAMGFWGATALGVAGYSWMAPARPAGNDDAPRVTSAMVAVLAGLAASAATVDRRAARAALPLLAATSLAFFMGISGGRGSRRTRPAL